ASSARFWVRMTSTAACSFAATACFLWLCSSWYVMPISNFSADSGTGPALYWPIRWTLFGSRTGSGRGTGIITGAGAGAGLRPRTSNTNTTANSAPIAASPAATSVSTLTIIPWAASGFASAGSRTTTTVGGWAAASGTTTGTGNAAGDCAGVTYTICRGSDFSRSPTLPSRVAGAELTVFGPS